MTPDPKAANPAPPEPLKQQMDIVNKNKAFSEDMKRVAQAAATTYSAPKAVTLAPMFPIDGDVGVPPELADPELAAQELRRLTEQYIREQGEWLHDRYHFFVRCHQQHSRIRPIHGIYVRKFNESGLVLGTDWRAGYKPTFEEPWPGEIVCQVCLRDYQQEIGLHVRPVKERGVPVGSFYIVRKHFFKRPKIEFADGEKRYTLEGETRVFSQDANSSNIGRDEAHERARAAGLEVR